VFSLGMLWIRPIMGNRLALWISARPCCYQRCSVFSGIRVVE
jgi:hypothetical protein